MARADGGKLVALRRRLAAVEAVLVGRRLAAAPRHRPRAETPLNTPFWERSGHADRAC